MSTAQATMEPFVAARGIGARLWDQEGNEYIDYTLSCGSLVLGHAPPVVLDALDRAMRDGTSFGMPTALEVELADRIVARMPHLEMMRFTSSDIEATTAITRLARMVTGRTDLLTVDGCPHGHADSLTCAFNDLDAVEQIARTIPLACIMLEPIVGNDGFVEPTADFLPGLRRIADETGALLVFDESMTGFRIAYGGARERFNVTPDLTALGKVIGGGLPLAAYGGRGDLMTQIAPSGPNSRAATRSGNPLAMAAGIATLRVLTRDLHDKITARTAQLIDGLRDVASRHGVPFTASHAGSIWGFMLCDGPVRGVDGASQSDTELFNRFFQAARRRGVSLAPSPCEPAFMSAAHGDAEIGATLERLDAALAAALIDRD